MPYVRRPLSGSTHGRPVKVTGTATGSAITVHTAQASTTLCDLVYLYATNSGTTALNLTIEFGGTTSPDDLKVFSIPAGGRDVQIVDGLPIRNGLLIRAFAATANLVMVSGYVDIES